MANYQAGEKHYCSAGFLKESLRRVKEYVTSLEKDIYMLKWALHIEIDGEHNEECDCKDHDDEARRLTTDFTCPGEHCAKVATK